MSVENTKYHLFPLSPNSKLSQPPWKFGKYLWKSSQSSKFCLSISKRELSGRVQVSPWNATSFELVQSGVHMRGCELRQATRSSRRIRPWEQGPSHYPLPHNRTVTWWVPPLTSRNRVLHASGQAGHTYLLLGTPWHHGLFGWVLWLTSITRKGKNIFLLCSLKYLIKEMWRLWKLDLIGSQLFASITSAVLQLSLDKGVWALLTAWWVMT